MIFGNKLILMKMKVVIPDSCLACTVKLGNKEQFNEEQIVVIKEPFPVTNLPFTS